MIGTKIWKGKVNCIDTKITELERWILLQGILKNWIGTLHPFFRVAQPKDTSRSFIHLTVPLFAIKICHYIYLSMHHSSIPLHHSHSHTCPLLLFPLSVSLSPPSTPLVHTGVTGLSDRLFPSKSLSIIQLNGFLWSLSTANNQKFFNLVSHSRQCFHGTSLHIPKPP